MRVRPLSREVDRPCGYRGAAPMPPEDPRTSPTAPAGGIVARHTGAGQALEIRGTRQAGQGDGGAGTRMSCYRTAARPRCGAEEEEARMNAVTASVLESASPPPTKVLVAVHGIGDQVGYATVQSVAGRLGAFLGCPAGIPLGRFYRTADKVIAPGPVRMSGHAPSALAGMGLAEVYWAAIARKVSQDGFILEESKTWARTITARLSAGAEARGEGLPVRERERIQSVLDEIIETVLVLDRLTFLARKAGVLDFNLRALLDSFVGDVQIVADFEGYRDQILAEVDQVMSASQQLAPKPDEVELYLVAHSEGTVIAFRALLAALADPDRHGWIRRMKGVMTIGSPIEVHHILWPHLWRQEPRLIPSADLDEAFRVPWINYMDYADPIAYPLTETTKWLREKGL